MTFSAVLISDYKKYLEEQIGYCESRITTCKMDRTNAIIKYKSLPWYKKILAYNPEYLDVFDYDDVFDDIMWLRILKKEMARAEYTYDNIGEFMNIDSDNNFWNWK